LVLSLLFNQNKNCPAMGFLACLPYKRIVKYNGIVKMTDYSKAIKSIISFKKTFDNIDQKIPKKLLGELGEFYVLQKLEKLGFQSEHRGGQGGYDIYLKEVDKKIEVRTSLLKNEGVYPDKTILFWGWRIENRNQKKLKNSII